MTIWAFTFQKNYLSIQFSFVWRILSHPGAKFLAILSVPNCRTFWQKSKYIIFSMYLDTTFMSRCTIKSIYIYTYCLFNSWGVEYYSTHWRRSPNSGEEKRNQYLLLPQHSSHSMQLKATPWPIPQFYGPKDSLFTGHWLLFIGGT